MAEYDKIIESKIRELNAMNIIVAIISEKEQKPIEFYRDVFCFLRANPELCRNPEYKQLYSECLHYYYLHRVVVEKRLISDTQQMQALFEYTADMINKTNAFEKITKDEVDKFMQLKKRFMR